MEENHDWNEKWPEPGTKVIRLPGHIDDKKNGMITGNTYIVKECNRGFITFENTNEKWDPNYFAPVSTETPKTEIYAIY